MKIERMAPKHAREVAALHSATLGGLLSRLSRSAVRAYYDACTRSPQSTAFVAVDRGRVVGFVAGAASPRALRSDIVQRNPFGVGFGLLIGGLKSPSALLDLLRSTVAEAPYDTGTAELIYLAVELSERTRGTGRSLVQAFSEAMRAMQLSRYELSVDATNEPAQRFYEKLGFKRTGSYQECGTTQFRYVLHLAIA